MAEITVQAFCAGGDNMEDGGSFARVKAVHASIIDESWEGGRPYFEMKCYENGKYSPALANNIKAHLLDYFTAHPAEMTCPVTLLTDQIISKKQPVTVVVGFKPIELDFKSAKKAI